jgi:hypothetical protein
MTEIDFDRIASEELPQARRLAIWMAWRHPRSRIIDVGCGPGIYTTAMREKELDAIGVDIDERLPKKPWFVRQDITDVGTPSFNSAVGPSFNSDIALSLEVGEHIPAGRAFLYIAFLKATDADMIYFSAARPGQGGEGHVNCQPKRYWLRAFCDAGFYLDPEATDEWLSWMRQGDHMGWLAHPELGNGMILRRL